MLIRRTRSRAGSPQARDAQSAESTCIGPVLGDIGQPHLVRSRRDDAEVVGDSPVVVDDAEEVVVNGGAGFVALAAPSVVGGLQPADGCQAPHPVLGRCRALVGEVIGEEPIPQRRVVGMDFPMSVFTRRRHGVFRPRDEVLAEAAVFMAREKNLDRGWINDRAVPFMSFDPANKIGVAFPETSVI